MEIQGKIWGTTSIIFSKNNVEVHRIVGESSSYSSKHKHDHKYNMFFVEEGHMVIDIWKDYGLVDSTILLKGQSCTVEPGLYHRFNIIQPSVAYEFYWVQLDVGDIIREDVGGILEKGINND